MMMTKLSKQQEIALIEKLCDEIFIMASDDPIPVSFSEIKEVISQCVDKPFPAFTVKQDDSVIIYVDNIYKQNHVSIDTFGQSASLTYDNFKQFVERCNKIVEWIDER